MNNLPTKSSTINFICHMCKYLGVGLISGSIVHAGTLGGDYLKYIVLIVLGIALFVVGNILEHGIKNVRQLLPYIAISTVLSIGTGMVSGGTQHYLDGPEVAAILFPVGLLLGYLSFIYRDYKSELTPKLIIKILVISVFLFVALSYIAKLLPEPKGHHHGEFQQGDSTQVSEVSHEAGIPFVETHSDGTVHQH